MLQCDTMPRPGRSDARRRRLLETARALFVEHGFHRTGMAQIAAVSGIAIGQIYRDFASKEAIIAEVVEADIVAWLENDVLEAAVTAGDIPAVRAWIARFGKSDETRAGCQMMADIVAEAGRNPRVAAIYRAIDEQVRTSLTAALVALSPAGQEDCDVRLLAEFILAAGQGTGVRRILHPATCTEPLRHFTVAVIDRELDALASAGR